MDILSTVYEKVSKYDLSLVFISIGIVILGLINLNSATSSSSIIGVSKLFKLQLIYVIIGFIIMLALMFFDYRKLERIVYPSYLINVILLVLVLLIGQKISGSKRWLNFGFINFQPSEFMKLCLVLAYAKFFSNDIQVGDYTLKKLFVPFLMMAAPVFLILAEPDLGTSLVVILISFFIFLFVRINTKSLLIIIFSGLISIPLLYNFALKDYQKARVLTFLDPASDPKGSGYNSLQSRIAVGSGQIIGKGYKKGTQSQLNFLPEHHTDFVFSVLAEEHGFLGSILVVILYTLLMISGINVASKARDKFGVIICIGCVGIFFWHALVNIGMVIGIMPVVGLTLPFMSYGGTSIIVSFMCIGIMQSVAIRRFMF